ncbi:Alpha/beta hydrolase family protein [Pigmentiphaga humi]|uniref:Alpha/beta hydrolase family protein n=1 Tax=Pigmentiphaga humi TaxID=2478468 RepID=A0A3P4B1H3_9BURK|nr:alpha/beta hydrolase [Pigmentiphaga humi]VCU68995.1 Alpha/beta hydrolase family protein [Pigmentiphaga humi]
MRLQPLIIPGWNNSGPGHWQSLWESELPRAQRVQQHDWNIPTPHEWVAALSAAIDAAPRPPLLIAHSLGCITICHLPSRISEKVAGALLVAPADVERDGAPAPLRAFCPIPMQTLPFPSVVVASTDDPYCRLERASGFAQAWGSRLEILANAGHINADSGYGAWPEGLKMLAALRRRAYWRVPVTPCRTPPLPGSARPAA